MEVILLERIEKLGKLGDVVKLKLALLETIYFHKTRLCVPIKKIYQFMKKKKRNMRF